MKILNINPNKIPKELGILPSKKVIWVAWYFKPNCKLCFLSGGKFITICLKDFHFVLYIWITEELKRTRRRWKISFSQWLFGFIFSFCKDTYYFLYYSGYVLHSWFTFSAVWCAHSPTLLSFLSCQLFCLCFMCFSCMTHILFALYLLALHTEWAGWSSAPLCSACSASCRLESALELVCCVEVQRGF